MSRVAFEATRLALDRGHLTDYPTPQEQPGGDHAGTAHPIVATGAVVGTDSDTVTVTDAATVTGTVSVTGTVAVSVAGTVAVSVADSASFGSGLLGRRG